MDRAVEPLPLLLPAAAAVAAIRPEVSVPCTEAFDDPDWLFTVDWEGSRAILVSGDAGVRIQDDRCTDVTRRFPEVAAAAVSLGGRRLVLDGVLCALDADGRPDLTALGRRLALGPAAAGGLPVAYLATDLLHLDAQPSLGWPLVRRLEALHDALSDAASLQAPDHVEGWGTGLAEAARSRGLPSLLARRRDAVYRPGMASPDRLRIATAGRATCVVAALGGRTPGMLLAERAGGRLVPAGWAPLPREREVRSWLERRARSLAAARPAFDASGGETLRWLRPELTATVAHAGRQRDGTLRSVSLIAVRDDCDPDWCVRREPVPPPASRALPSGFVPRVLLPLPLDSGTRGGDTD
jgi:bifunctional non-homologous end joining protein LigD